MAKIKGKCPTCGKNYMEGVEAAYKLGVSEGESKFRRELNNIKTTHGYLFEFLKDWIDKKVPYEGNPNVVVVETRTVQHIIEILKDPSKISRSKLNNWIYHLRKLTREQHEISPELIELLTSEKLEEGNQKLFTSAKEQ